MYDILPASFFSKNEQIDDFIQEKGLKWIPYNHLDDIKEIGKYNFTKICSAIWKDYLFYDYEDEMDERSLGKHVTLRYLYDSQNKINKILNEV